MVTKQDSTPEQALPTGKGSDRVFVTATGSQSPKPIGRHHLLWMFCCWAAGLDKVELAQSLSIY